MKQGSKQKIKTLKRLLVHQPEARVGNEQTYFSIAFWSLGFFGAWAKLILGRLGDAVLPDFSRFPAGSDDYLNAFFTDPRHGRYCGGYIPGA